MDDDSDAKSPETPKKEMSEDEEILGVDLISMEKLDRASPELWPEKIPGVDDFISSNSITTSPTAWLRGLSHEDINSMHQLGALSSTGLIVEIRKLYDQAYSLGIQEAKEMTRGRYLNIFSQQPKKK